MEIILIKDIPGLGFKDEVVNVKNGYGRNYIIPQGLGVLANKSNNFSLLLLSNSFFESMKWLSDMKYIGNCIFIYPNK